MIRCRMPALTMIWERIWSEYIGQPPLFWGLHLSLGVLTLGYALWHVWMLLVIRKTAKAKRPISDHDVQKLAVRASTYLSVYEYFSCGFILTGLLGTIYGFFVALSNDARGFSTSAVSPALVTSGFGIVWALLTGLVSSFMELWCGRIPRWFSITVTEQDLITKATERLSQQLDNVTNAIGSLTSSFQTVFEGGSKSFAAASQEMTLAATQLRQSVDSAAGSFTQSIQEAARTTQRLDEILNRTLELPTAVASVLEKFSDNYRNELYETGRNITARLDDSIHKFEEMIARTMELPAKVDASLEKSLEQLLESLAVFSRRLFADIHDATMSVAIEIEKTRGLPTELAKEMQATHQAYQASIEGIAARTEQNAATFQVSIHQTLDDYVQRVNRVYEEQTKQLISIGDRLTEWTEKLKNLPADIAHALAEQQIKELGRLNETTTRIWQETVRVLDDARDKLEKEAENLEIQRTELYKEETDRIRERFTGILQEVDKLTEGIRTKTLEAFTQGAGNIPDELQKFGARLPELAAAVRDAAKETQVISEEFRKHAKALSEEVSKLREQVEQLALPVGPIRPTDGQLLMVLQRIEAGITTMSVNGITMRHPAPSAAKEKSKRGMWATMRSAVRSKLPFRRVQ
jgi:hypothetical protein